MSYNIDTWKTKKIDNLTMPLSALYEISEDLGRRGWRPDRPQIMEDGSVVISLGESEIKGRLANGILSVSEIDISGEGSGIYLEGILKPALKRSKGKLTAVLVWEGGDSVNRMTVEDGEVTEEEIDL